MKELFFKKVFLTLRFCSVLTLKLKRYQQNYKCNSNQKSVALFPTMNLAPSQVTVLDVRFLARKPKQDRCTAEITSIYSVSLGEPQCKAHILFMG